MANLENQITKNQLTKITNIRDHFIGFPLKLGPKFNSKWYKIHYLLYFCRYFVNCHISKELCVFKYKTIDKAKQKVI